MYEKTKDEFAFSEPISLEEIRKRMDGKMPDIPGIFRYARDRGVRVSDLGMDEKRMFVK